MLKEMKLEVETYQKKGKIEAANRLRDQVSLLEARFLASQEKLNRFTSPQATFESRLNRALGELRAVERNTCILDVASACPNNVQDQFKHCLKMYRTLSEVKGEIENVIKTGRKICEDKSTKYPKKLSMSIDALKHLYNSLGEHVTQSKVALEKLLKIMKTLNENMNVIEKWIETMTELRRSGNGAAVENAVTSEQVGGLIDKCNELFNEYNETCEAAYLEELRAKIDSLTERFSKIADVEIGKSLLEIKSTLQNLDNISMDTLR